jgi:hypothetical protein
VPAGWYGKAKASANSQPAASVVTEPAPVEAPKTEVPVDTAQVSQPTDDAAAQAARRQREKEKEKAKAREEKAATLTQTPPTTAAATNPGDAAKSGPKKITVTVTYDESGRVTQASGADAGAVRIARQKRFPAGKAGSATITIPIN